MNVFRRIPLLLSIALLANQTGFASAQSAQAPPSTLAGQVPTQIAAAHSVFLTSAGASPNFPLDSTRVYNDMYEQLRAWGRFELVGSPEQADLVFEIRGMAPITKIYGVQGDVSSYTTPAFQLTIIDAHSHTPLWTITSPVTLAGSKGTFDRWATQSESNLVSRVKVVAGQPLSAPETAGLTTVPKTHGTRNTLLVVGGFVGLAAGGALLGHHLYENSLAAGKASQDAFCKANGIPLSMCAGG